MAKICVCIETVFPELPFIERIKKISQLSFKAIEFWFWDYEFDGEGLNPKKKDINQIARLTKELNIEINDIVVNAPDGSIGGFLTKSEDRDKYLERLKETIDVAHQLNCKKLITCSGNEVQGVSKEEQLSNMVKTLDEASQIAAEEDMVLLLEPLNSLVDHPGYFLTSSKTGFDIVKKINSSNLRLLYDVYHTQVMEGNILNTIKENISLIGHFHSAGVPGRHELDNGELNYPFITRKLDELGYQGYFGLEYFPALDSETSLKRIKELVGRRKE